MISKINFQNGMSVSMKQAPKVNDNGDIKAQQNFVSVPNNKGMDALGNYGRSLLNLANKLDVRPLLPTVYNDINAIDGERIYNSDGKLHSIVKENQSTKTTYYVPIDNQNVIDYIETIDKETGKPTLVQHNSIGGDGKIDEMYITKFNAKTGNEEMFTCYENGKIVYAGKTLTAKNGTEVYITKYYDGGGYHIDENNDKFGTGRHIYISEDKRKIEYTEERETPRGAFETRIEFFEGLPFTVEKNVRNSIPNFIGLDTLMDKDLIPAPKFDIDTWAKDLKNLAGEETHYSNGSLESKKVMLEGKMIESYFNTNNELERIVTPTMEIEVKDNKPIRVKQNLGENKTKETFFSESMTRVIYQDNGHTKTLAIDTKKMQPLSYHENKTIDGRERDIVSYYFNKFGNVDRIYTR